MSLNLGTCVGKGQPTAWFILFFSTVPVPTRIESKQGYIEGKCPCVLHLNAYFIFGVLEGVEQYKDASFPRIVPPV